MKTEISIADNNCNIIKHPKVFHYVSLREDYLKLAGGNHCAAKLLAVFEHWTNWFVRQGKFERWVKLTTEKLVKHLFGEHNVKQIRASLRLLVSLKLIRQEKRRSHQHDQAYFYWLDVERTQEAIDALEHRIEPETEEDYLKIEATLEAETLIPLDAAKLTTSNRTEVPHPCGQMNSIQEDDLTASLNRYLNKNLNTTDNIAAVEKEILEEKTEVVKESEITKVLTSSVAAPTQTLPATTPLLDDNDAINEMRSLGIERNETVLALIKKHKSDQVLTAIAYIQQRVRSENIKNITGAFVDALKKGKKPVNTEPSVGLHKEVNPPTEEQIRVLDADIVRGAILDWNLSSIDNIRRVIMPGGFVQIPWWKYLNYNIDVAAEV